jgi:phosphoadenosine phosphosulfate reductase
MSTLTGPGLDLTALRALRGLRRDHTPLLARIEAHVAAHDGYLAFSGGKDSAVVLDLARRVDPALPVVWFDSGCEFPETRTYIHHLADTWGLNLTVIRAQPTLLEVLVAGGGWDHRAPDRAVPNLHEVLITAPARLAHDMFGAGELWGVRSAEAKGRRHLHNAALAAQIRAHCRGCCPPRSLQQRQRHGGIVARVHGTTAYSPIWDWPTTLVWEYLAAHGIPLNPVYAKLRDLGAPEHASRVAHVVDANQLEAGRISWLRRGWPTLYAELVEHLPRLADFV